MELSEFKATWQMLDKALERGNRLSEEILRRQRLDAYAKEPSTTQAKPNISILFGILFIVLAALLWTTKPTAVSVILSGVIVQVGLESAAYLRRGLVFSR